MKTAVIIVTDYSGDGVHLELRAPNDGDTAAINVARRLVELGKLNFDNVTTNEILLTDAPLVIANGQASTIMLDLAAPVISAEEALANARALHPPGTAPMEDPQPGAGEMTEGEFRKQFDHDWPTRDSSYPAEVAAAAIAVERAGQKGSRYDDGDIVGE